VQAPLFDIDQSEMSLGAPVTPGGAASAPLASPLQTGLTSFCERCRLLVTGTDDGIATIWTCQPSLFSLVSCNLRQPMSRMDEESGYVPAQLRLAKALTRAPRGTPPLAPLDPAQAQDIAELGRLVHLGLVGGPVLLGLRFLVSVFTDDDLGSMVRLTVCEPMMARFLRSSRAPDGSYRSACGQCPAS
jgi:hypothetical protein